MPPASATVVADSGFRVNPNGFSFDNYGDEKGYLDLDADQMRRIFGNAVCVPGRSRCVLTPFAQEWKTEMNRAMAGGHCYGFSVLALLLQNGQLPQFGYSSIEALGGGPFAFDLGIGGNPRLQRVIARAFTFQVFDSVNASVVKGSPGVVLDRLIEELRPVNPETWTVAIFRPGFEGGHALTPYAVESLGNGQYRVKVYDNNWPNDPNRAITVDTVKQTWSYLAATNPTQPGSLYRGDARTRTLLLYPTTPGLGLQPCDFCGGRAGLKSKYNTVTLASSGNEHARLLITDPQGRRTGFLGDRLLNEIPGAEVIPRTSGGPELAADGTIETTADSLEPVYRIPRRLRLRIEVDGDGMSYRNRQEVSVSGPAFDASVERIPMGRGRSARLVLDPGKRVLSTTLPRAEKGSQVISFGAESRGKTPVFYRIRVTSVDGRRGNTVVFANRPQSQLLQIGDRTDRRQRFRIVIFRVSGSEVRSRYVRSWSVRGRQRGFLFYGPLASRKGPAKITIVSSDGKLVKTFALRRVG